jgi:hypothetical protein
MRTACACQKTTFSNNIFLITCKPKDCHCHVGWRGFLGGALSDVHSHVQMAFPRRRRLLKQMFGTGLEGCSTSRTSFANSSTVSCLLPKGILEWHLCTLLSSSFLKYHTQSGRGL